MKTILIQKFKILVLVILSFSFLPPSFAKIPPLSKEELQNEADLIVEGIFNETKKMGKPIFDTCSRLQKYRSIFIVNKLHKGQTSQKLVVVDFKHREKVLKDGCVGGSTSYNFKNGDHYKLHLIKIKDENNYSVYRILNWAGVEKISLK